MTYREARGSRPWGHLCRSRLDALPHRRTGPVHAPRHCRASFSAAFLAVPLLHSSCTSAGLSSAELPRPSKESQQGLSCLVHLCHPTSDNNLICSLRGCVSLFSPRRLKSKHRVCRRVLLLISPHNHPTFLPKSQPASLPTSLCGRCPRAHTSIKTSTKTRHRRPSSLPGDTAPLTSFARRPSPRHRPGPTLATLATSSATSTTRSASSCRKTLRTSCSPESSADS